MRDLTTLRVDWNGQSANFTPGRVVRVGRSNDCDVVISDERVSRAHLDLEFRSGVWVLTDHSTGGTFSAGVRFQEASIVTVQAIRIGGTDGPELLLTPLVDAQSGAAVAVEGAVDSPFGASTITTNDQFLRLRPENSGERLFPPGSSMVIGRDADCDVVIDDPLVSRKHLRFTHDGSHWYFEDLDSSRGTYMDDRRVRRRTRAEGTFSLWLGGLDAGAELGVISAGEHRSARSRLPLILSGAAVLLAALVGIVALLAGGSDAGGEKEALPQVDRLAESVVLVVETTPDGEVCARGSGSVLDDGLVLTNFHVVAQYKTDTEKGSVTCGAGIRVLAGDGRDETPSDEHDADVLIADPDLDLAVLRVAGDLPYKPVELGDSARIGSGDAVRVLGYPGVGGGTLTVTDGIVSGFEADHDLSRAWIKTDTAIARGNSGGAAFDRAGRLVGVPTQSVPDIDCKQGDCVTLGQIGRLRPVDFAKPLIQRAKGAQPIPFGDPRLDEGLLHPEDGSDPGNQGSSGSQPEAEVNGIRFAVQEVRYKTAAGEERVASGPISGDVVEISIAYAFSGMADGNTVQYRYVVDGTEKPGSAPEKWSYGSEGSASASLSSKAGSLPPGRYEIGVAVIEPQGPAISQVIELSP